MQRKYAAQGTLEKSHVSVLQRSILVVVVVVIVWIWPYPITVKI